MSYDPFAQQYVATSSVKRGKQGNREVPMPCLLPTNLYAAIRASAIRYTLDENKSNLLNANAVPIGAPEAGKRVVLYSPDLLVLWCKYLVTLPMFGKAVVVAKHNKGIRTTGEVICLYAPTRDVILNIVGKDVDAAEVYTFTAAQLQQHLLGYYATVPVLTQPSSIPIGTIPQHEHVTTPNNVCRPQRLVDMGYAKYVPNNVTMQTWIDFHNAEEARLRYCIKTRSKSASASDTVLRRMDSREVDTYNALAIDRVLSHVKEDNNVAAVAMKYIDAKSKGVTVDPSIVAQRNYDALKTSSSSSAAKVTKLYRETCDKYYMYTGYRLDIATEEKSKTLMLRLADIEWMVNLRRRNPAYIFEHDVSTNRPKIHRNQVNTSVVASMVPQVNVQPVVQRNMAAPPMYDRMPMNFPYAMNDIEDEDVPPPPSDM